MPSDATTPIYAAMAATPMTLFTVNQATAVLSRSKAQIWEMIDSGDLWPCFNIGTGRRRRELRIWRESVFALLHARWRVGPGSSVSPGADLSACVAHVLPPLTCHAAKAVFIPGKELALRWSCGRWLLRKLVDSGDLVARHSRTGRQVSYKSAAAFLTRRALP